MGNNRTTSPSELFLTCRKAGEINYLAIKSNKNKNKNNKIIIVNNKSFSIINDKNKINEMIKIKNMGFSILTRKKNKIIKIAKLNRFSIVPTIKKKTLNKVINLEKYVPKGLVNFTLNCYMNSLLQCFYYIHQFRAFFLSKNFEKSNEMCESLKDLMIGLSKEDNNKCFKPIKIKNEIKKKDIFCDNKGGDVTDLLCLIFDKITNELGKEESSQSTVKYQTQVDKKEVMFDDLYNEIDFDNIIINKLFVGFYEKEYTCENGHVKYSFQNEYRIIFPLEEIYKSFQKKSNLTLYDCFDYYQRPQSNNNIKDKNDSDSNTNLDKESENNSVNSNYYDNSFNNDSDSYDIEKCYKCGNNCILREKIYRTPKILIIILDRGPNKKCDKKVEFNNYIDLKKYIDDETYEYPTQYQLIGVSTHLGTSGNYGHYISICLCDDNNYYLFNDETVCKIDSNKEKNNLFNQGSPYILFYQRLNTKSKENLIKKTIKNLKKYINDIITQLEFNNKSDSNFNDYGYKVIFTTKNKKNEIDFHFEIDFSEYTNFSDNLKIKFFSKEINNDNSIEQKNTNENIYRWNKKWDWSDNEKEVKIMIDNCFEKLMKQNGKQNKYCCNIF